MKYDWMDELKSLLECAISTRDTTPMVPMTEEDRKKFVIDAAYDIALGGFLIRLPKKFHSIDTSGMTEDPATLGKDDHEWRMLL